MKPTIQTIGRVALTLALVGAALGVGRLTWDHYRPGRATGACAQT